MSQVVKRGGQEGYICQWTGEFITQKVGIPEEIGETADGQPIVRFRGAYMDWNCVLAALRQLSLDNKLSATKRDKIRRYIFKALGGTIPEAPGQNVVKENGIDFFLREYAGSQRADGARTPAQEKELRKSMPTKHQERKYEVMAEEWMDKVKKMTFNDLCFHRRWDESTVIQTAIIGTDGVATGLRFTDPNNGKIVEMQLY